MRMTRARAHVASAHAAHPRLPANVTMENMRSLVQRNQVAYEDALEPVRDHLHTLIFLYNEDEDDVDVALRVDEIANGLQGVFRSSHVLVNAARDYPELIEEQENPVVVLEVGLEFLQRLKRKLTKNPMGALRSVGRLLEERLPALFARDEEDELAGLMSGVGF